MNAEKDKGEKKQEPTRRDFIRLAARGVTLAGLGAGGLLLVTKGHRLAEGFIPPGDADGPRVWQIDPYKCIQCGNCATYCVLNPSAVKCMHAIESLCGYCEPCFGYFNPQANEQTTAAENVMCPTDAIDRRQVNGPNFQYTIDESKCIGCARCAKGCNRHGNGSLYMQVRHDRCVNCSQCSIAAACPSGAFVRVRASSPYLLKPRALKG